MDTTTPAPAGALDRAIAAKALREYADEIVGRSHTDARIAEGDRLYALAARLEEGRTTPREYRSNEHLHSLAGSHAGAFLVRPQERGRIVCDAAWSNSYPADEATGEHGSTVLDIGRGVQVRASFVARREDDGWTIDHLSAKRYPGGGELTFTMTGRLTVLLGRMVEEWADAPEAQDALTEADEIYRHNGARTLEEEIARHERSMERLKAELAACEAGQPFESFPTLETKR